jgi:hypothetical protein
MNKSRRYAGASPFNEEQSNIFFGREAAASTLHRLIRQENIVVLHSKSGIGKSSLIRAGLLPIIRRANSMEPVEFRLFAAASSEARSPLAITKEVLRKKLETKSKDLTPIDKLLPNDNSLWRILKEIQIRRLMEDREKAIADPPLLLIFDQFEELFTHSRQEQLYFRSQLAEATTNRLPQRYWEILSLYEGMEGPVTVEEKKLLMRPMRIHVLTAIREDRIHLLGELTDYLPAIGKNWFKLDHLNEQEATRAIEAPARQLGDFATPAFTFAPELRKEIIHYLSSEYVGIESAQLQVICDAIDRKMAKQSSRVATLDITGELENITSNYYWEKIKAIDNEEQELAARRLIEEQLIFEEAERRLTLYGGQILETGLEQETLDILIDSYLLRSEPDVRGGYNYEISHDSLIRPILEAKHERLVEEQNEERKQKEADQAARLAKEIKENRRSRRLNIILTVLLTFSVAAGAFSAYYYFDAKKSETRAEDLLSRFQDAQDKILKEEASTRSELRQTIRLHLDNADIYLDSEDAQLAREELTKAMAAAIELESTDFEQAFNRLRLRIQAMENNE